MDIKIKILRKGDQVINAFPYGECFAVAVRRKAGQFDIVLMRKNKHGAMEIADKMLICEGDDTVETKLGELKVTTA